MPHQTCAELIVHQCQLGPQAKQHSNIVKFMIETGLFVGCRRIMRRWTMISRSHPLTRSYVRSTNELLMEERRHLLLYPYMIHPFSMFSFWVNIIMVFCYLYIFLAFTVQFVINRSLVTMYQLYYVSTPFYVPLIIISFFTGYHDAQENRVILKCKHVCWHYMRTYFLFDVLFLSCIVFICIYYEVSLAVGNISFSVLTVCAFVRYPYFLKGIKMFKMYTGAGMSIYYTFRILIGTMTCFLFIFAFIFNQVRQQSWQFLISVKPPRNKKKVNKWLLDLQRLFSYTQLIMGAGQAHNNLNRRKFLNHYTTDLAPIIFIPLGFACQLFLAVRIMQFWNNYYSAEGKNDMIHLQFKAYMSYKAMPDKIKNKISTFLDFKYQKQLYEEKKINTMVTDSLRKEILVNATSAKLNQVTLFRQIPEKVLKKLLLRMELEFFMPGDVIIKAGATGTCMFFISVGSVIVTTNKGKEVCVLKDGAPVGEIALITKTARVANVTALTPCELYRLKSKDFQQVMRKYPQSLEEMREMAFGRIAKTKSLVMRLKSSSHKLGTLESKAYLESEAEFDESDEETIMHLL